MDGEVLTDSDPSSSESTKTFTEVFRSQFPHYLAIGMTYAEFWDCDPFLCVYYREADNYRWERENFNLWLLGEYIFHAMNTTLANAFAKKGSKPIKYLEKPFRITPLTDEEREEERKRSKQNTIDFLNNLKLKWDRSKEGNE